MIGGVQERSPGLGAADPMTQRSQNSEQRDWLEQWAEAGTTRDSIPET